MSGAMRASELSGLLRKSRRFSRVCASACRRTVNHTVRPRCPLITNLKLHRVESSVVRTRNDE
eukprot:939923-Rhodomonas_salina.1